MSKRTLSWKADHHLGLSDTAYHISITILIFQSSRRTLNFYQDKWKDEVAYEARCFGFLKRLLKSEVSKCSNIRVKLEDEKKKIAY